MSKRLGLNAQDISARLLSSRTSGSWLTPPPGRHFRDTHPTELRRILGLDDPRNDEIGSKITGMSGFLR